MMPIEQLRRVLGGQAGTVVGGGAYGSGEGPGQVEGPPKLGPAPPLEHLPGGQLVLNFVHPAFNVIDREFRILPNRGWFSSTVSPDSPIVVPMGALHVPKNQLLFLLDYRFFVFRQSGVDPFDFIEAAPGRFSGFMGFELRAGAQHLGNTSYQLDPIAQPAVSSAFQPPLGAIPPTEVPSSVTREQFALAQANSFASSAGAGTALLPVQSERFGPRDQPFMTVVGADSAVSLSAVIFRRITTPVSAIAGKVSGYLLHQNTAEAILNRIRPQ